MDEKVKGEVSIWLPGRDEPISFTFEFGSEEWSAKSLDATIKNGLSGIMGEVFGNQTYNELKKKYNKQQKVEEDDEF